MTECLISRIYTQSVHGVDEKRGENDHSMNTKKEIIIKKEKLEKEEYRKKLSV